MGLAGSSKKYETYKGLQVRCPVHSRRIPTYQPFQRSLRDLTMNARISWEVPWAQVPARDKAKLFEVVSTRASRHDRYRLTETYIPGTHSASILGTIREGLGYGRDCQTVCEE